MEINILTLDEPCVLNVIYRKGEVHVLGVTANDVKEYTLNDWSSGFTKLKVRFGNTADLEGLDVNLDHFNTDIDFGSLIKHDTEVDEEIIDDIVNEDQEQLTEIEEELKDDDKKAIDETSDLMKEYKTHDQAMAEFNQSKRLAIDKLSQLSKSLGAIAINFNKDQLIQLLLPLQGIGITTASIKASIDKMANKNERYNEKLKNLTDKKTKYLTKLAVKRQKKKERDALIEKGEPHPLEPEDHGTEDDLKSINKEIAVTQKASTENIEAVSKATSKIGQVTNEARESLINSEMFINSSLKLSEVREMSKTLSTSTVNLGSDVATVATKYIAPPSAAGPYPVVFNPALAYQDAKRLKMSGEDINSQMMNIVANLGQIGVPEDLYNPLETLADTIGTICKLPLP